jgi:DNA mismatch endonuclease Vsr
MQANRRVSAREVAFRKALWASNARGYRVQSRLPGRPDLTFPALKLAVFVHGCFWHSCQSCTLPKPRANAEFWQHKLSANQMRDSAAVELLVALNWQVITIWEHEIRPDPAPRALELAQTVAAIRAKHSVRRQVDAAPTSAAVARDGTGLHGRRPSDVAIHVGRDAVHDR